ncbi:hypothetical protein AB0I34_36335 [Kribbella sp. NPDC050281]|uniref:hypothetical protein n=1 Tax=Kribbella sp. NPDC050281 TaxID=3155515 RepID=UPI0034031A66
MTERLNPRFPPPTGPPIEPPVVPGADHTSPQVPPDAWPAAPSDASPGPSADRMTTDAPRQSSSPGSAPSGDISAAARESLLARARSGDREAIATMFRQFLPKGEEVLECHYLGVLGFWGIGTHSFAAVTRQRVATLRISVAGGVQYQDGLLQFINAAAVFQPSKVLLYVTTCSVSLVFAIMGSSFGFAGVILLFGLSLLLLPITVRLHHRFQKSGIVLSIREGFSLYSFIDRKHMRLANQLYRLAGDLREDRLRSLGRP